MTTPEIEGAFLDAIADGHEIDRHWVDQNRDLAEVRLKRVPNQYADAVPDNPVVAAWVRGVIANACATARAFNPRITTGPSLLIFGGVGTGKTHQAYGAIRTLALAGISLNWELITAGDLFGRLRPNARTNSEDVLERYSTTGVLVLDDLGAEKGTEWTESVLYRLINHRYVHHCPTIVTTNIHPAELRDAVGDRVVSRLREMTHRVVLEGADRRKAPEQLVL